MKDASQRVQVNSYDTQQSFKVRKYDASTSCQLVTFGDLEDSKQQYNNLARDLDAEKKRTESLTFKLLSRDEELKKLKESTNAYYSQ